MGVVETPSNNLFLYSTYINMPKKIDLLWLHFWYLIVINKLPNKWRYTMRECKCKCGNIIKTYTSNLKTWHTQSCWCLQKEKVSFIWKSSKTHWMSKTKFYSTRCRIKERCYNKNCWKYNLYWWRWIIISSEWKIFSNFYNDMYDDFLTHILKYWKRQTTLDRIDSNWNYCKENCRRATYREQNKNRRNTRSKIIGIQ